MIFAAWVSLIVTCGFIWLTCEVSEEQRAVPALIALGFAALTVWLGY